MLRSMTGFGAAAGEAAGRSLRIEVRAVNHRHLQVKMRLAAELVGLESEIDALVRKRLRRGMVNLTAQIERASRGIEQSIDVAAAERYREVLAELSLRFGGGGAIPVETVLALPGVIAAPADQEITDAKPVLKLVAAALDELEALRAAEGAAIAADLRRNAATIAKLVARVGKRMPKVVREHQAQLQKRVADLLGDAAGVDPKDLAREVALLADRLDVSEEVERLKCHLEQFERFVERGGDAGRKLDFLVQEIFREANTIGSKCSDAQVAHLVVDVKTHIERLREQAQNVE
jgi:uncharacterized protein (TIGR00255 family)